jgi:serine/threonine protein kinase
MSETSPDAGSGSDKYRTLFELGQGGTANVSVAVAQGPDGFRKLMVVKRLRAAYAQDPDLREMFMTEARLSARLNHPHVVQVYEVFEHDGTPTIAMEFIEGQTLDTVLALTEDRLTLDLHLRVLADVLSGLHYSHEILDLKHQALNVVHRDVSPHNVMLSYEGVVKVLDFGIAKLSGTTIETETGVIKGKLRYMPPEQIAGEEVDRRADVFAVGVMLWEALSGSKLWKGLPDATIMNRVLAGDIPPPHKPDGEIAPELMAICLRALAPLREDRYQSALELEQAIEDYLAKSSHYATARELGRFMSERFAEARTSIQQRIESELGRGEAAQAGAGGGLRQSTPTRTSYTTSRSLAGEPPRSRLWIGAVGFVALGVLILFWGLREQPQPPPAPKAAPLVVSAPAPSVGISIQALPANAEISIDGVPVSNPYVVERARDKATHRVRVTAPGFVADEAELVFDTDVRIFRALSALPAPVTTGATLVAPAAASRPGPTARAAASVDVSAPAASGAAVAPSASVAAPAAPPACDPPYFLDPRGIKKFKPECI